MIKKLIKITMSTVTLIFCTLILVSTTKGNIGNPISYQNDRNTQVGGPYEASNSTARYALIEAMVEDKTFLLDETRAKFAAPDVVDYKGKFVSIFTPGVSMIAVPFYIVGKSIGAPQLLSYSVIAIFALINVFLIARLSKKMGANFYASLLSGVIFLLASNALSYAQSLTQHHITVTLLLISLLNITKDKRTIINNIWLGALFGIGILIDIPNPIFMLPIIFYALAKHFEIKKTVKSYSVKIKLIAPAMAIGLIPFVLLFGYYNYETTGSYTKIAQNIGRSKYFTEQQVPGRTISTIEDEAVKVKTKTSLPFNTRRQIRSSYILLISNERSWIYYSPVVILGLIGLIVGIRKKEISNIVTLMFSIALINIVLYSMFGDPWGGWAFGPRYLIPSASIACVFLSLALTKYSKNILFLTIFSILSAYSVWVNNLGAVTTSMIPPKVEAVNLPQPIPYTYKYNLNILSQNKSSALVYNLYYSSDIELKTYFTYLNLISLSLIIALTIANVFEKQKDNV